MKTYKAKSSANRAAKKIEGSIVEQLSSGEWAVFASQVQKDSFDNYGVCNCPNCGIDLDNGVNTHANEASENTQYARTMKLEFVCLACNTEFGPAVVRKAKKDTQKQQAKYFNSSTIGSPCKAVWDMAGDMPGARRKEVIAACVKAGIAFYTARTQYQQWKTASKAQQK